MNPRARLLQGSLIRSTSEEGSGRKRPKESAVSHCDDWGILRNTEEGIVRGLYSNMFAALFFGPGVCLKSKNQIAESLLESLPHLRAWRIEADLLLQSP